MPDDRLERKNSDTVTDTLMRAMEHAEDMKHVVVLYTSKDDVSHPGGVFTQDDMTLSEMNWLLDLGKSWIFSD